MRHLRWLTLYFLAPVMAGAAVGVDGLNVELERLQTNGLWAEATLSDGRIRPIFVEFLSGDSVTVREVIGPLQERQAVYALSELSDLRELGVHRVPLRRALYQPRKSMLVAQSLELLPTLMGASLGLLDYFDVCDPDLSNSTLVGISISSLGLGHFYTGEKNREGVILFGVSAATLATGVAIGEDGAAAWAPLGVLFKIGALLSLRDQVRAGNRAADDREGLALRRRSLPDIEIGMLQSARGAVPALRLRTTF